MSSWAEIISIGEELTTGQRLDTNSQWLSQRFNELGLTVHRHTTVPDEFELLVDAIDAATRRSPIVVTTGGIGPTADDLTRQAIAQVAGVELILDEASLEHIKNLFARRKREMTANNEIQAYFPAGSSVIFNENGSAPGIDLSLNQGDQNSRLFALPGVPAELKQMWREYVAPQIRLDSPQDVVISHFSIHSFGAGESDLATRLPGLIERDRQPLVGITASKATITFRITATAVTQEECDALIKPTATLIYETLGDLVYGTETDTLASVVLKQLELANMKIALVDFGLNGLPASMLADEETEHTRFLGGWSMPHPNDVSTTLAQAKQYFQADLVLAIGKLRRIGGHSRRKIWLHGKDISKTATFDGDCHPDLLPVRSAKQALNWLRLTLNEHDPADGKS